MVSKLHYITQEISGKPHWQLAKEACKAGINWVQLRVKGKDNKEWKYIAQKTQEVCVRFDAKLIINDNVALAHDILADGVHLGKTDMKPGKARSILGENFIIGGTANNFDDILFLQSEGVDYIGLGPFRYTDTKKNLSLILGIEGYKKIIEKCRKENIVIPIIAIGGIKLEDVVGLISTGVYGVAVASAINLSNNIGLSIKDFFIRLK